MKSLMIHSVAVICGFVCLVSCNEQESDLQSVNQSANNQLRIVTHTREGEEASSPIASVYLFNSNNEYVRTLQTDADGNYTSASASVKLPEGSYTLCAVSPSDLPFFRLPAAPVPTSAIALAEGQAMSDFLMATSTVTVADGNERTVDMVLQRKVLELSSVTISQVPADVIGVSVSIAPFYSAIQFNGTYVDDDPLSYTFNLTATATTGVWQATPQQLTFPSKGVPTITVTFTRSEEDTPHTYTCTAEDALSANNKYNIAGTYTEPLGITLSGSITLQPWSTDPSDVTFDFDETNATNNSNTGPTSDTDDPNAGSGSSETTNPPVAGQLYKGCYVVSVDEENHTAVLLSPSEQNNYNANSSSTSVWLTYLTGQLSSWPSITGVTGTWRIPSSSDYQAAASITEAWSTTRNYFCIVESEVNVSQIAKLGSGDGFKFKSTAPNPVFDESVYLRPVIDISY